MPPPDGTPNAGEKRSWRRWIIFAIIAALVLSVLVYGYWGAIASILATSPIVWALVTLLFGFAIAWRFQLPAKWQNERDIVVTVFVLAAGVLFGLYLASAAGKFAPEASQAAVVRIAMGWSLGYFSVGFVVGFLFGIPRVLQSEGNRKTAAEGGGYEQRVNTNLEQISDWLTKIIVGLGLVQLRTVPAHLQKAAQWMAQSFLPPAAAGALPPEAATSFAGALIIFFAVLGFLGGYLTTRLFLAGAFGRADRGQVVIEQPKSLAGVGASDDEDKTNVRKLRDYWKPGEVVDAAHKAALEDWLKEKNHPDVTLGDLIVEAEHADLRKQAVAHFQL
jgi:MFS family permease